MKGGYVMKNSCTHEFCETVEAKELYICTINEASLYPNIKHVVKMLAKKYKKGNYDPAKAPLAYLAIVDEMAKKYCVRFCSPCDKWYNIFSPQDRYSAACLVAESFYENVEQNDL